MKSNDTLPRSITEVFSSALWGLGPAAKSKDNSLRLIAGTWSVARRGKLALVSVYEVSLSLLSSPAIRRDNLSELCFYALMTSLIRAAVTSTHQNSFANITRHFISTLLQISTIRLKDGADGFAPFLHRHGCGRFSGKELISFCGQSLILSNSCQNSPGSK